MMNPFIAALMQQTEQASKDALADNDIAMPMMFGGFGGLFGQRQPGGLAGGMGQVPGTAPPPAGYGRTPWAPRQPVEVIPYTAPTPAAYSPDPVPEIGFSGTPSGGGSMVPPVGVAPTMPEDAAPLASDYTASMVTAPRKSAAEVAAGVLGVPSVTDPPMSAADVAASVLGPTESQPADVYEETRLLKQMRNPPASIIPEGLTPLTADFTAQKAAYVPEVPSIVPVAWDTSRAPLAGVDPNVIQAFEEAANAVNAAGGTFVPTIEMWSGADNHSRNHAGHAADIAFLTNDGVALDWNDPWVQDWSVEAARRGMRQLGAGPAYMKRYGEGRVPIGGDRIHAGGITPGYDSNNRVRVWSDSDPEWGSDYAGGISGQSEWLARLNAAINDPVALGTPIPEMAPQAAWWEDAPMGGPKVGVDDVAGFGNTAYAAANNFNQLLPLVLAHEGGYSNHPNDSGGPTMNGVTQARYDQYRRDNGLPTQDVRNLAENERSEIYRRYYFDEVRGAELPPGVDYAMFDFAVNSGPSRAIKFTQEILGIPADGKMGPETMAAIQAADPSQLAAALNEKRLSWLQGLGDWQYFGAGWEKRVNDVSTASQQFATSGAPRLTVRDTVAGGVPAAPSVGALPDDDWQSPYNNRNLVMFGGVADPTAGEDEGRYYHGWGFKDKHDNDYEDYSQFYREFSPTPKPGYVDVSTPGGRKIYAAPAPEYVNGMPVDRDLYVAEARRRGALIPTEAEMRAFYAQAQPVRMPTIPDGGGPNDRISFDDVPDGPWYGPKEFYRTNDSPALPIPANLADAMQRDPNIQALMLELLGIDPRTYGGA